jgi:phytoene synthase
MNPNSHPPADGNVGSAERDALPPLDVRSSYAAARASARREARHFYFAFRWLPAERRDAMCAIYCFLRRLDDLADEPAEEDRLRADRFAPCRAILGFAFDADGCGSRDPIAPAFADTVRRFGLPREDFEEAIRGAEMDLEKKRYGTFQELRLYCHRAASVVGRMCLHIFGHSGSRALALADELGVAFQLTNILRDLREDAARGRLYIPAEDLARFGVEERELLETPVTERVRRLLAFESERARELYEKSAPLVQMVDAKSRRTLLGMRDMYRGLLRKIEARDYDVVSAPVRLSTFEKLKIGLRAYLRWA